MARGFDRCRSRIAGQGRLAAGLVACALSGGVRADAPRPAALPVLPDTAAAIGLETDLAWDDSLARATFFDEGFQGTPSSAPAAELAAGLDVQVEQKRRKFRSRVVDFMQDRSVAFGRMTDFLLGGADSGWHFVVDPTGEDEYTLQWKAKFR
jgi:hypothetical protein